MTELLKKQAIVIGSGDWLERILPGMRTVGIEPVIVVGRRPPDEGRQRLDALGLSKTIYAHPQELLNLVAKVPLEKEAVAVVISKPNDHEKDALLAAELPVIGAYVEKPFATSLSQSEAIVRKFQKAPPQLVGGDHYLAGKSQPLEWLKGLSHVPKDQVRSIDSTPVDELFGALNRIGQITAINGRIVEGGKDPRGDIKNREWLEDRNQGGGVISDLATHLMSVGERVGIWGNSPTLLDMRAEVYDRQAARWKRMPRRSSEVLAERYATLTYKGAEDARIVLTVGKVGERTDVSVGKSLEIQGTLGKAYVDFAKNQVHVNLQNGTSFGTILVGEPYTLLWKHFLRAIEGKALNNIQEVVTAVGMVEEAFVMYKRGDTSQAVRHLNKILSSVPELQRRPLSVAA